ncbi:MAG: SWIM zinc finger family protein [Fimbriimonas sp.]
MAKKSNEVLPIGCYNAIRDLVMQQLLPVVHKWGRHYRQHCEGVMHEVTTSIVESQNSATKGNHSYSVKCQMTLDHSLETLTEFGRNYIDRKMQHSATQCSKSALNSKYDSKKFLTDYAEGIVSCNLCRGENYYVVRVGEMKWLVCSKFSINKVMSESITPSDVCPKFVHVREVSMNNTDKDNICELNCSCSFYTRVGLPCAHVLLLCNTVEPSMCKVRWWKVYHYSYLNDFDVTEEIDKFLEEECKKPTKITVSISNIKIKSSPLPELGKGVTENIYEAMVSINKNLNPVTYDGPYVEQLRQQLVSVDDDVMTSNLLTTEDDDGRSDYCGVYSEFSLSQEQHTLTTGNREATTVRTTSLQQERYHRCMAAVNEVLKVCVESEESTALFIEKVSNLHNEMIQKLSYTIPGETITCCLPLESRKSAKRKKTLGYI